MTNKELGFRLIARGNKVDWMHETSVASTDVDCTDMSDEEFEAQLCRTIGLFNFATVPA